MKTEKPNWVKELEDIFFFLTVATLAVGLIVKLLMWWEEFKRFSH